MKMKSNFFFILIYTITLLIWSPLSLADKNITPNLETGWNAINMASLKKDVYYLSSDRLQGRLSLSAGDEKAIDWIQTQFKQIGLKPAFENSYLQPVKLIEYIPDRKKTYIQLERANKIIQWKKPDAITEYHEDLDITGDVVFAGYGITAPDLHYDDYQDIDVHGKIVLVFEHEPQENDATSIFNGKANTIYATSRIKALNAQKHGAIAILIAPEPNRKHPSNQERLARIGGSLKRKVPIPSQVLIDDELHIPIAVISDAIANKIIGAHSSLSQLQTAIDKNLKPQSRAIPDAKITIFITNKSRGYGTTYNVVGLLEGSDSLLKNETIIISAHHDHDGKSKEGIWHGADDNASGTAGVISLANAFMQNSLAKNGLELKRSLLFVVFAAEERGLLGAYHMTNHPIRDLKTTRAMINFDMIGRNELPSDQTNGIITIPNDTHNRLNLIGAHYSPSYLKTVIEENQYIHLTLDDRFDNEPALNTFFRSDQFPFVLHQIPAFWWFTGFHPDYHHITDTADKINYKKMQKILRLAYLTGYAFSNDAYPPEFITHPNFKKE